MHIYVDVVWAFVLDYTKGWGVRRHSHDYFQMYYCLSGEGQFFLDGRSLTLKKDDCLIIRPEQDHELFLIQQGQCRVVDRKFYIRDHELLQATIDAPHILQLNDQQFRYLQQSLRDEWASGAVYSREMANLLFQQSLYRFLRQGLPNTVNRPF